VFRIKRSRQPWSGGGWFGRSAFGWFHERTPGHGWHVRRHATHLRDVRRAHNAQRINASVKPVSLTRQLEPKSKAAADFGTIGQRTVGLSPNYSKSRTMQEQVAAATEVAERMTTVAALAAAHDNVEATDLVAIVMARPQIKSVADLAGKSVAMDERYSAYSVDVWVGFVVAGTDAVEVSAGHTAAIDRLSNGEVTAAVLALVSPDAADGFPEIPGFKIFRVPFPASKAQP
jgi:hypothetical protein